MKPILALHIESPVEQNGGQLYLCLFDCCCYYFFWRAATELESSSRRLAVLGRDFGEGCREVEGASLRLYLCFYLNRKYAHVVRGLCLQISGLFYTILYVCNSDRCRMSVAVFFLFPIYYIQLRFFAQPPLKPPTTYQTPSISPS